MPFQLWSCAAFFHIVTFVCKNIISFVLMMSVGLVSGRVRVVLMLIHFYLLNIH